MLRLAKWAYSLGVRQERLRIARALEVEMTNRERIQRHHFEVMHDPKLNEKSAKKRRAEKLYVVQVEVQEIVAAILQPKYDGPSFSVLFPEEDKKE